MGKAAKRQIQLYPENTVHSIKRFIGRRFKEAQSDFRMVNYTIERELNGDCSVRVEGRRSFPLMPHFFGLPYIDVRVSFNSFIPADLEDGLAGNSVFIPKTVNNPLHKQLFSLSLRAQCNSHPIESYNLAFQ